ncbi:O-methyltransferase [Runella slithyformis]|uniref:Caffeoyl-CoA O-methyltransferase n=1 Tax=Runella slithyformis (strain ATCC 29530 / DSM 19594 / LMG 11500 / NCIMB 11436 / LSU 4) TaxID=761193 RepID=A0A7U4E445_RUNSL|nr:O-methyltransferase [Runella slithyformis]AEI47111.1 Caffeoyl-CoA O-methyltransferase [Runella slithyformis DSM 19594]
MDFLPAAIEAYALAHTSAESPLLAQLNRETHAKVLQSRMLSGHLQGRLLALFSTILRPRRILEIGTYTGYSALCLAEGLTDEGLLITIDINEELEAFTRSFFERSPLGHKIDFRIANAATLIPTLDETFDLVFIDADKLNYGLYYDLVFDKVRPGGVIIADNVLWSGKIVQTGRKIDKDTQALLDFNQKLHHDPRVSNVLLPVRDGLMIVWKH